MNSVAVLPKSKTLFATLLSLIAVFLTVPAKVCASEEVLILNSYHLGYSWSDEEMAGIREQFLTAFANEAEQPHLYLYNEFLDTKRFKPSASFVEHLKSKYSSHQLSIVIALDNPALEFALKYRLHLFPKAPIIFGGINGFTPDLIEGAENITGVAEALDEAGTLELALSLHPTAKDVYVVSDYTITGRSSIRELQPILPKFQTRVHFHFMDDVPVETMIEKLNTRPADSVVLILSYGNDSTGTAFGVEELPELIAARTHAPIYAVHANRLGHGIIGGALLDGHLHGHKVAELATRVLRGEKADSIPVALKSTSRPMFDYRRLQEFGISTRRLPPGSEISFKPNSIYTEYRNWVLAAMGLFLVLSFAIFALVTNIVRRKTAEHERTQLNLQLHHASKLAAIGTLAAGVAHEINNPLGIIQGKIDLLHHALTTPNAKPFSTDLYIAPVERAIERIAKIVNSLRTFARADTDHTGPIDVARAVEETVKFVESIYRKDGIDVTLAVPTAPPGAWCHGNMGKLQQVIMNLLSNAKDALEGREHRNAKIEVTVTTENNQAVVRVSDNGCGIKETDIKHIFDPFFTTKAPGKGTGLGLSISHSIIQQMHGEIQASSELGSGTSFTISLPLLRPSSRDYTNENRAASFDLLRGRALIAEDEEELRHVIAESLTQLGLEVEQASDGKTALKMLLTTSFDYVITDLKMPEMNGDVLLQKAREVHAVNARYVVITGGAITNFPEETRAAIRRLAHAYLIKPFTRKDLYEALTKR